MVVSPPIFDVVVVTPPPFADIVVVTPAVVVVMTGGVVSSINGVNVSGDVTGPPDVVVVVVGAIVLVVVDEVTITSRGSSTCRNNMMEQGLNQYSTPYSSKQLLMFKDCVFSFFKF